MGEMGKAMPKMKRLGMLEMKYVTVRLAEKYDRLFTGGHLSQLGFLGYMYEICNFSHGERSIQEIARALSHELQPIKVEHVYQICKDLTDLGFMDLSEDL